MSPLTIYLDSMLRDALPHDPPGKPLWQPPIIRAFAWRRVSLTHLLFVDDIVLFSHASSSSCSTLMNILLEYSSLSGQSINKNKCKMVLSKLASQDNDMITIYCFHVAEEMSTYLGIPLSKGKPKLGHFQHITEAITRKLHGWKARCLSFAGRICLINYQLTGTGLPVLYYSFSYCQVPLLSWAFLGGRPD